MNDDSKTQEQEIQQNQYDFPYHYVPRLERGEFSQTRHWWWGFRYFGGFEVVFDALDDVEFSSLIDIGCGDGRFLREVADREADANLLGIDYSRRAIDLANALNPAIEFRCHDILDDGPVSEHDVATLIEVLEHVPPKNVDAFIGGVTDSLASNGVAILTVPHTNKPVQDKHFQHFDRESLRDILSPYFEELEFVPFDVMNSTALKLARKLLGGRGNHVVVTNRWINSWLFDLYRDRYLYTTEDRCGRIAVICRNPK